MTLTFQLPYGEDVHGNDFSQIDFDQKDWMEKITLPDGYEAVDAWIEYSDDGRPMLSVEVEGEELLRPEISAAIFKK